MKIAIIGAGPVGIYAALYFEQLGASVVLFEQDQVGGRAKIFFDFSQKNIFFKNFLESKKNDNYPAFIHSLEKFDGEIKFKKVKRIQKRFLSRDELVEGKSRLIDLFRIVYQGRYSEDIEAQQENNREFFKKLGPQVIESLKTTLEGFIDVDLVIDATGPYCLSKKMGPGGAPAINEELISSSQRYYGLEQFIKNFDSISKSKKIGFVASHPEALIALLSLEETIFEKNQEIFIITPESNLGNLSKDDFFLKEGLKKLMAREELLWDQKIFAHQEHIFKWRDLEDYEKAKIPFPELPKKQFEFFNNCNVTSIDKLLDQEQFYLTLERPPFRGEELLKTIGVDTVCIFNGYNQDRSFLHTELKSSWELSESQNISFDLEGKEIGLYSILCQDHVSIESSLLKIEKDILKYFGKRA